MRTQRPDFEASPKPSSLLKAWARVFLDPRAGLALVAGLLLALSFPTFDRSSLAWLAPGCMLLSGLGAGGRRAFGLGYLAGLAHYLLSLDWLLHIPFAAGAIAGWLALSAYLAVYPAAWVWLCTRVLVPGAPRPPETTSLRPNIQPPRSWHRRL